MKAKTKQIDVYKIENISYPIVYKERHKPKNFDSKWLKALSTIKDRK